MKGRRGIACLLVVVFLFGLTGCSKTKVTEKDDPKKVLEKAEELMQKEQRRSSEMEKTYYYSDGVTEKEQVTVIYDGEKGIRQETTEYEMGFEFTTYHVNEDGKYYVYIQESSDEEQWVRYEESEGSSLYEYYAKGVDFSFTEENGYHNVEYSNEGADKVSGEEAIKIKVAADIIFVEYEEENSGKITRESLLAENGWTEEEVKLVEGFSEIIDNYVAANNLMEESAVKYEQYIWVDASTNKVLKTETTTLVENEMDSSEASLAIATFENEYWRMAVVHSDIEAGVSPEQAVKNLEEELAMLEEDETTLQYFPTQTKETVKEYFSYGKEVKDVDQLPDQYMEMTEEEYYGGMY